MEPFVLRKLASEIYANLYSTSSPRVQILHSCATVLHRTTLHTEGVVTAKDSPRIQEAASQYAGTGVFQALAVA